VRSPSLAIELLRRLPAGFPFSKRGLLTLLNPLVELSWLHGFGDRCGWEIGLNAGAGIAVSGRTRRDSGAGSVTSLISFFTGFRF
jgi:hypothetical protein